MAINADKPTRWKADIVASVDQYNNWFINFAPATYRDTRLKTIEKVGRNLASTGYLVQITPNVLMTSPDALPTLRMSTAPPLARDRLIGLAQVPSSLVDTLEQGKLPRRMQSDTLLTALTSICAVISRLVDEDLFSWLADGRMPTDAEQARAATVVADRLCGAFADPIIRNAQESRQLSVIGEFLASYGYTAVRSDSFVALSDMQAGSYTFRRNVPVGGERRVNIPIDVVIQPHHPQSDRFPILIEAKSAGDFTNTNKRRKEEATKIRQLRDQYGQNTSLILFLCGYFDTAYLGYEAAEGLDWVWEHRIADLLALGLEK
jgi:hypothetical protein